MSDPLGVLDDPATRAAAVSALAAGAATVLVAAVVAFVAAAAVAETSEGSEFSASSSAPLPSMLLLSFVLGWGMCECVFDIGIAKTGAHCHFRFMFALTGHVVRRGGS